MHDPPFVNNIYRLFPASFTGKYFIVYITAAAVVIAIKWKVLLLYYVRSLTH